MKQVLLSGGVTVTFVSPTTDPKLDQLISLFGDFKGATIMSVFDDIKAAQAATKADLAANLTLLQQILAKLAAGEPVMTPEQAQQLLTEAQSEDSTVKSLNSSMNAVLNTPPA
jgi:ABC-type transporter Mla subunit MlaD